MPTAYISLKRNSNFYFYATFMGNIIIISVSVIIMFFFSHLAGLLLTIFIMHVYKHAQPALLYLVPACLGVPLFLALVRGDIKTMFQYEDTHPDLDAEKKKDK